MADPVPSRVQDEVATIASGSALSSAVNLRGRILVGLVMPGGWNAADLTFQASLDGATWREFSTVDGVGTAAPATIVSPAAGVHYGLEANAAWFAARHLRVRSGTSASPVNQAAERAITLLLADSWG